MTNAAKLGRVAMPGNKYAEWISKLENPDIEELDIDLPEMIEDAAFDDWENAEEFLPPQEPGE
jgi:hypothetical protein